MLGVEVIADPAAAVSALDPNVGDEQTKWTTWSRALPEGERVAT